MATHEAVAQLESGTPDRGRALLQIVLTTLAPIVLALLISGGLLLLLGVNPLDYYQVVIERGLLSPLGLEQSVTRMGPLLLVAAGLIVSFRAGIWNLGVDGQFLLGAVIAAATAPILVGYLPVAATLILCAALASAVGAIWALLPAVLRAYQGVNEIITTLMMTFLGTSFANVLVKLIFLDPTTTVPQTRTLTVDDRLPRLFGTTINSGLIVGLIAIIGVQIMMTRTSLGLKLRTVGANPAAAAHAGLPVTQLTVIVFALSAGLIGLAGGIEIMGTQGNVRADWNPAYGLAVIPLVFLARLNGYGAILFVLFFSVLTIGGESAARRVGVPTYFTLVLIALIMIILATVEYYAKNRRAIAGS